MAVVKIFIGLHLVISACVHGLDVEISNSLTVNVSLNLIQCAPGPYHTDLDDVCKEICNCCGCINSDGCKSTCIAFVGGSINEANRFITCGKFWGTVYNETNMAANFTCPNPAYNNAGNVKGCQMVRQCCDGQNHDADNVQGCAVSISWNNTCAGCAVPNSG